MSRAHFPSFPLFHLHHNSFSTVPSLYLRHSSFSNSSVASPTSQFILQPFRHFTYVTTHSPILPSLCLRHSSFSSLSVASPTSQSILQPLYRFSYVTSSSLNSPGEPPMIHVVTILICLVFSEKAETRRKRNRCTKEVSLTWLIWGAGGHALHAVIEPYILQVVNQSAARNGKCFSVN